MLNLLYSVEINPTRNEIGTGLLSALQFKTVWVFIQCCLTSMGYKGFGFADLRYLYNTKIFKGGEIVQNLLFYAEIKPT